MPTLSVINGIPFPKELPFRPRLVTEGMRKIAASANPEIAGQGTPYEVKVFWIASADEIPQERKPKILSALYGEGLLERTFGITRDALPKELYVEYFDNRGGNRRVMLLAIPDHEPVIFKYTHEHRVHPIDEQFKVMRALRKNEKLQSTVVEPHAFCIVEGTELFTEQFVDGITRGEYTTFLRGRNIPDADIDFHLSRLEAKEISQMYETEKKVSNNNLGFVLGDLTERNSKFYFRDGKIGVAYFDFEDFTYAMPSGVLDYYCKTDKCFRDFFRNPGFALGWIEGAGLDKTRDLFRTQNLNDNDQLGIMISILHAYQRAEELNQPSTITKQEILEFSQKVFLNSQTYYCAEEIEKQMPYLKPYTEFIKSWDRENTNRKKEVTVFVNSVCEAIAQGLTSDQPISKIVAELKNVYLETTLIPDKNKFQFFTL